MLKNITPILSPEMLKVLSEMGCGDEIVIADGNFPAAAVARRLIRADSSTVNALLDAVLSVTPLCAYSESPIAILSYLTGSQSQTYEPPCWERLRYIVERHEGERKLQMLDKEAFVERARRAYAVIATGDREVCSIVLRKGLVLLDTKDFRCQGFA
ncbi:MAG: fucose isomerase [Oscillospiraceae bacterium]|nr:fucose isomerase [Oscillospiraceae bacterium]